MYKVKILIVGPCASGKTTIANFLADASEMAGGDYRPTQGVRILEFESSNLNVHNKNVKAEVEIWDCSGDHKFEQCWPALQRETHGIIFVFNPEEESHGRELELLYNYFVTQTGLSYQNCIVFAHYKSTSRERYGDNLSTTFSRIPQIEINLEEDGNRARVDFNNFLATVVSGMKDIRDQEELNIINMRN